MYDLSTDARQGLERWLSNQVQLNNGYRSGNTITLTVEPRVAQRMERARMESHEFLRQVNSVGVTEQEGEKIGISVGAPVTSTNATTTTRRDPRSVHSLDAGRYRCEQINRDTFLSYQELDAWASQPSFQHLISQQIAEREGLDRLLIGFNGTHHAAISDPATYPMLEDVAPGWLQHVRDRAPQRVMHGITLTQYDASGKPVAEGTYGNYDSLVYDARTSLLEPWYRDAPGLAVICGSSLFDTRTFGILNRMSQTNPNTEALAGNTLAGLKRLGGLPVITVPYFPAGAILITVPRNLSVYWMKDKNRRLIRDEPEYNRIATYNSANEGYVVEDFGAACLIEGITFAGA
ncbi:TPA: phage major capsid protein, P2 family [Escherichia coli]|nr:phage major capsid protein, P2 family [Escherichia coli]